MAKHFIDWRKANETWKIIPTYRLPSQYALLTVIFVIIFGYQCEVFHPKTTETSELRWLRQYLFCPARQLHRDPSWSFQWTETEMFSHENLRIQICLGGGCFGAVLLTDQPGGVSTGTEVTFLFDECRCLRSNDSIHLMSSENRGIFSSAIRKVRVNGNRCLQNKFPVWMAWWISPWTFIFSLLFCWSSCLKLLLFSPR